MDNAWVAAGGPHPKYAILPVLLVLAVLVWVAAKNPEAVPVSTAQRVTAMKPIEGGETVSQELPIEVLYGVPSERTLHLWRP